MGQILGERGRREGRGEEGRREEGEREGGRGKRGIHNVMYMYSVVQGLAIHKYFQYRVYECCTCIYLSDVKLTAEVMTSS